MRFFIVAERTEVFRGVVEADSLDEAIDKATEDIAEHDGSEPGVMRYIETPEFEAYEDRRSLYEVFA